MKNKKKKKTKIQIVPKCVTHLNASTYIEPIMTIFAEWVLGQPPW